MLRKTIAMAAVFVTVLAAGASAQEDGSPRYSFYTAIETGYEFFAKTYRHSGHCIDFNSRYYFGDPSFIICTQQCFSVGNNQVLSFMIKQFGKLNGRKNYIIFGTKHDIRTIVLFYNTRSHIFTTHIRTCIHVGNKSDCGYILIYIGRKRGKKIAMLVQSNILQA